MVHAMALALLPLTVWATPSAQATPAHRGDSDWKLNFSADLAYDDNVFEYSQEDIKRFKTGESPERFGFKTIGDFFLTARASAEKCFWRQRKSRTYLETDVRARVYEHDTEADDLQFQLGVRHVFDRKHWARLRFTYLPDYFVRRLYDRETSSYVPAEFNYAAAALTYGQRFSTEWSGQVQIGWERRDYNLALNERDSDNLTFGLLGRYEPNDRWGLWAGFETQRSDARAHDAFPDIDADVSFDQNVWSLGARYRTSSRDYWQGEWQHYGQVYTTRLTPQEDPYHSGRVDATDSFELRYHRRLGKRHALEAAWLHEQASSSLDPSLAGTTSGDSLGYVRNLFSVGYTYGF